MIYGYDSRVLNEHGLKQMKEISILARPDSLRALAEFLLEAATELEAGVGSDHWHKHGDDVLRRALGCDVIVLAR